MAYLFIAGFLIYTLAVFFANRRKTHRLGEQYSKFWRFFHLILFVLIVILIVLNQEYAIDLRGLWTSRIFWFAFLFTGLFYSPLCAVPRQKIINVYFKLFSYLPFFSLLFTFIPFLGIIIFLSCTGQLFNPADKIFYEDNALRVESRFIGVLGPARTYLVEKKGLFERTSPISRRALQEKVTVRYSADSLYLHFVKDSTTSWDYSFKRW